MSGKAEGNSQPILLALAGLTGIVLVCVGLGHGHWFKCNDVIRYGVWEWCASRLYFRFSEGDGQDYRTIQELPEFASFYETNDNEFDNRHFCRGYGDNLYKGGEGVPWEVNVGRVCLMVSHAATIACIAVLVGTFGGKIFGVARRLGFLISSIFQMLLLLVFCGVVEWYLDRQETVVNRTVVCWNGIFAWLGWCFSVLHLGAAAAYFAVDDSEAPESIMSVYDERHFGSAGGYHSAMMMRPEDDFGRIPSPREPYPEGGYSYRPEMET